jgi:hypothetical protein
LVTGKGVPDLATRAFVQKLHMKFEIPVLAMCDWNPFGLALLVSLGLVDRVLRRSHSFILQHTYSSFCVRNHHSLRTS